MAGQSSPWRGFGITEGARGELRAQGKRIDPSDFWSDIADPSVTLGSPKGSSVIFDLDTVSCAFPQGNPWDPR
jgi:hypothetical protein